MSSLRNFSKKIKKFSKFQPKTHKTVPKRIQKCFEHVLGQFFRKNFKPSAPWRLETSKIFKKVKIISKFQKCPKSFPKVFKRGLNKFWRKLLEKFLTSFPWSVESSKHFKKNQKIFKNHTKNAPNRSRRIQKCFEHVFGQIFRKIFAQFSMECRVFETFQKKSKNFQNSNQKRTKPFPKESKSVLNMFWGNFFEKFLSPVLHGGSRLRKFSKKSKKISKFQKCPKSFPKVSKRVLNMFWGKFFEKVHAQCSMDGRVFKNFQKNQKNFKIPKMPKIVPKSIQTCFEQVLGRIFRKIFAQFSMECRVFETFQKKSKNFQNSNQKRTKPFPKESKSVLNMFWGNFFEKFLSPVLHGGSKLRKFSKKSKKFQNSKNARNRSQKYSNVV